MLVNLIKPQVKFIAPIHVYPGEDEMTALAEGTLRALSGKERIRKY
jgi:butyrate kinase